MEELINKKVFDDTLEAVKYEYQMQLISQEQKLDAMGKILEKREQKNKKQRESAYLKNRYKENDKFVKHFAKGSESLLELKQQKKLSCSDIGKFALLCSFLEKDTGIIVSPTTRLPMSKSQMCKELGENRQHFATGLGKLIGAGLVFEKPVGKGRTTFHINPEYAFNGESRLKGSVYVLNFFNGCEKVEFNQQVNPVM
jgi:hypothetical protein